MTTSEIGLFDPGTELDALASIVGWAFGFSMADARAWLERAGSAKVRVARQKGGVVGGLLEIPMGQWFGSRSVSNVGIAGVAVAPEARGRGVALELVSSSLRAARRESTAVSTLYPANVALYRAAGYELAGSRFRWTLDCQRLGRPTGLPSVRPIVAADAASVEALYRRVASERNGYLDRGDYVWDRVRNPRGRETRGYLTESEDGNVEGYAYLSARGPEDRRELALSDLVAQTPAALARLLRLLADHQTTLSSAVAYGAGSDALLFALPERAGRIELAEHFMLRIVDVERALVDRGYPPIAALLDFELADDILPENAGRIRLEIENGLATTTRGGRGSVRLHVRALAALYTGFLSPLELLRAGALTADGRSLGLLGALFGGPPPTMADFF